MSRSYSQSKLANILFTHELARRLEGTGVTANCVHPGVVKTNLGHDARGFFRILLILLWPFFSSPGKGAETSIYVASASAIKGVSGKYFIKKKPAKSAEVSYDEAISKRLWQISAQMVNIK
jgi:NAD(P)-dependent dehydrogenase (short-subunit alcohol dehydrogenase family)